MLNQVNCLFILFWSISDNYGSNFILKFIISNNNFTNYPHVCYWDLCDHNGAISCGCVLYSLNFFNFLIMILSSIFWLMFQWHERCMLPWVSLLLSINNSHKMNTAQLNDNRVDTKFPSDDFFMVKVFISCEVPHVLIDSTTCMTTGVYPGFNTGGF